MNKIESKKEIKPTEIITDTLSNGLSIVITVDDGKLHASISRKNRHPTWEEIKDFRYKYLPDDMTFGMLLPPKKEYVNLHPHCFHLWEISVVELNQQDNEL